MGAEELRLALLAFQRLYNEQWILERQRYRTPQQVRQTSVSKPMAEAG